MSAVATAPARRATPAVGTTRFGSTLTGTGRMIRFILRRDRVRLTVWTLSLLALYAYFITALGAVFPTEAERQGRARAMEQPASIFLGGPNYGLDDYTLGAMFSNEMTLWMIGLLGIMNMFEVVRNTRAEEEDGRAELVRANPVGRHAPAIAALVVVVFANVVFALLGSALLIGAGDLEPVDTFALSTGIALSALVFAAVAVVTCQITVSGRGASGLGLAVLGAAVLVRGIGDLQEEHGSPLSWLSPIAWTHQMRAFVDLRLWPMALSVAAIVILLALGAFLAARRDFGGGMVSERGGRANASTALASPLAMALRQHRTAMFWWLVGCVVMFGASGTYMGEGIEELIGDNPMAAEMFGEDPLTGFLAIMIIYAALAAVGYVIATTLRAKSEETSGRLEIAMAAPVSRGNWLLAQLSSVTVGAVLLLFVGGSLSLWAGAVTSEPDAELMTFVKGGAAFLPAIAVVLGLTAALYAWLPRATPVMWALFAFMFISGLFGPILDLPDEVLAISPFWWVGRYPQDPIEAANMWGLSAVAAALLLLAFLGFRRRDLPAV